MQGPPDQIMTLRPQKIEFFDDVNDSNVINFIDGEIGFFLLSCTYLEDDNDLLNKIYTECCGQENGRYDALETIEIHETQLLFYFRSTAPLMGKYQLVEVDLPERIDEHLVDFFYNFLFVGDLVRQCHSMTQLKAIRQTATRDRLD